MRITSFSRSHVRVAAAIATTVLAASGCFTMGDIAGPDFEGGFDLCSGASPVVARIDLQPTQAYLRVGSNVQVEAKLLDPQAQVLFLCHPPLVWSSSNPTVATVSAGLVVAVTAGKAFIRAQSGGGFDSVAVTVAATSIGSVAIVGAPASLLVGQTARLRVVVRDTDGQVVAPQLLIWQTDDATVATVSAGGMVIAVNEGIAVVTAVAEGVTATARIPVTRDAPVRRFRQIAAGAEHSCAIVGGGGVPDGTAFCWGANSSGQLGNPAIPWASHAAVPMPVSGGHTFAFIAVSDHSSCALAASGEAYCWGDNDAGQLGDGTTTDRDAPVRVSTTLAFRSIAMAGALTCALTGDGAAYCWGRVTGAALPTPTRVGSGIEFAELTSGGGGFVCGRTAAGRAYCWGTGFANGWAPITPTSPRGDMLFSQISAGSYHVCGVAVADGLGYCWGRLQASPLGATIPDGVRDAPVAIPGGLRFTSVSAGGDFTCGVTSSGSYCLGAARLSNSDGSSSPRPIPKEDQHRFVAISGGDYHACAIDANGGGWCWGTNFAGQVGAGEFGSSPTEPLQLRIP